MPNKPDSKNLSHLPELAAKYIQKVIRKMRYCGKARRDVQAELAVHFEDALQGCASAEERQQRVQKLISEFGDAKMLASLLRRAKKRCRPLWAKVIVRTFQAGAILLVVIAVYAAWFVTGEPTISVDYLAMMNQMSRPKVLSQDNAWPDYEKAIGLLVEPSRELRELPTYKNMWSSLLNDSSQLAASERQQVEQWVAANEAALKEFSAGSSKPYCYRGYSYDPNCDPQHRWLLSVQLPHLASFRTLARLAVWRARLDAQHDRSEQAMEGYLAIARAGAHWQHSASLMEQLVGISLSRVARENILHTVANATLSVELLSRIQQDLSRIYPDGYPLINLESERLAFLDVVQNVFTDGGPGGGHLVPDRWAFFDEFPTVSETERNILLPIYTAVSMAHAGRNQTVATANRIYDDLSRVAKMTPYARHCQQLDSEAAMRDLPRYRYYLIHILMPAAGRAGEVAYRGKVLHEATLTVLAIQRWRLEHDQYPLSAQELVKAGYLDAVPMDSYSDKPLIYRRTDQGFILYSAGPNFVDDGGVWGTDSRGEPRNWLDNGDTIFWPVEKPASNQ